MFFFYFFGEITIDVRQDFAVKLHEFKFSRIPRCLVGRAVGRGEGKERETVTANVEVSGGEGPKPFSTLESRGQLLGKARERETERERNLGGKTFFFAFFCLNSLRLFFSFFLDFFVVIFFTSFIIIIFFFCVLFCFSLSSPRSGHWNASPTRETLPDFPQLFFFFPYFLEGRNSVLFYRLEHSPVTVGNYISPFQLKKNKLEFNFLPIKKIPLFTKSILTIVAINFSQNNYRKQIKKF